MSDASAVRALLEAHAEEAGLTSAFAAFPEGPTLRERLVSAPFLMAPMAGVSDGPWRLMALAGGAALGYTEMVSVAGIHYGSDKTWELVDPAPEEGMIAVQLFGSKPEQFREAAEKVCERLGDRLALIDINMACPVPKVVRKGEGSALMDEPERAAAIVSACREAVCGAVDVTAKIRRGRRMGEEQAPEFARALEQAGASAIAVHGRFANQLYRGEADWGCIQRVCEAVSVPVIGSGDVLDAASAVRVLHETGADAVMVARGTYGNPWIFSDARMIAGGGEAHEHSLSERLAAFRLHVRLMEALWSHMARARSLAGWYFKGIADAAAWRARAMECRKASEFIELADRIEEAGDAC